MVTWIIAHAGEAHTSDLASHIHDIGWYIQLPLFVLILAMICSAVWLLTKKIDTALLVTSFIMLVSSFLLFQIAPLVSVLAITIGLVVTLLVTFVGLGTEG